MPRLALVGALQRAVFFAGTLCWAMPACAGILFDAERNDAALPITRQPGHAACGNWRWPTGRSAGGRCDMTQPPPSVMWRATC